MMIRRQFRRLRTGDRVRITLPGSRGEGQEGEVERVTWARKNGNEGKKKRTVWVRCYPLGYTLKFQYSGSLELADIEMDKMVRNR